MPRRPTIARAQVLTLPRPAVALGAEWLVAGLAAALLLAALLGR